ncbi:unnamed protein product [Prorocentrum cordatum]|uniref:Pentacotripeptide-repeat region of PRORP domain-containing protein n=1 Tax=Prorocentrum cordatum TaxID=2364126 RepID=A0ABN9W4V3_9DINO|nr:unnamed protein product [Polarella glacialis]
MKALTSSVAALGRRRLWEKAAHSLDALLGLRLSPDVIFFGAVAGACARGAQWPQVLSLLAHMRRCRVHPDVITYNASVAACQGGQWRVALGLLDEMERGALQPDIVTYSAAVTSCEEGRRRDEAARLLLEMRGRLLSQDVVACGAEIDRCGKQHWWERAVAVLRSMRACGLVPNLVTYNAAISACERGRQPGQALALLEEAAGARLRPDGITLSAAISGRVREGARLAQGRGVPGRHARRRRPGRPRGARRRLLGGFKIQRRKMYRYRYPSPVFPFFGLLGGSRCHRWIRFEILFRTHPGRGPGSSGIGTIWFPQRWRPEARAKWGLSLHRGNIQNGQKIVRGRLSKGIAR